MMTGALDGRVWSLITRFRFDADVIPPKMVVRLAEFTLGVEAAVKQGVTQAIAQRELRSDTLVDEIICAITNAIHSASVISRAPFGIAHLKLSYQALSNMIFAAYGSDASQ